MDMSQRFGNRVKHSSQCLEIPWSCQKMSVSSPHPDKMAHCFVCIVFLLNLFSGYSLRPNCWLYTLHK